MLNELSILLGIAAIGGIAFAGMSFLRPGSNHQTAFKVWIVALILGFLALLIPWSLGGFDHDSEEYAHPYKYGDRPY